MGSNMFNPLMGGSSINNIQPKGTRPMTNENSIPGFSLNTTGGADTLSLNNSFSAQPVKQNSAPINTRALTLAAISNASQIKDMEDPRIAQTLTCEKVRNGCKTANIPMGQSQNIPA